MNDQHQPRFLAYCEATGPELTPEEVWSRDGERYPGGKGTGYMVWIQARIREWREEAGHTGVMRNRQHKAFDLWLRERDRRKAKAA